MSRLLGRKSARVQRQAVAVAAPEGPRTETISGCPPRFIAPSAIHRQSEAVCGMAHEIGMPGKPQKARLRRRAALRANSTMAPDMRLFRVSARKQSRRKRLASERSENVLCGHDGNRPLGIQRHTRDMRDTTGLRAA